MNTTYRLFAAVLAATAFACSSFQKLKTGDPNVSEQEVAAAGRSDDPTLLEPLRSIVQNRDRHDTAVLVAAIVALGQRRDPSSIPALSTLANDSREEVRWQMVRALHAIGGDDARSVLARIAADDPSEFVRDEALDPES